MASTIPASARPAAALPPPSPWASLLVWLTALGLGYRLFSLVNRYSVNILYWDQWDYYIPLFHKASLWRTFAWQHGPARSGVALIFDKFLLGWTRWNVRAESFALVGVVFLAMLLALQLKKQLFPGPLAVSDVMIPLMFLTIEQFGAFVETPNPYTLFPLLLLVLYCLAWLLKSALARYGGVLLFHLLLLYTGYGMLIAPITLAVLLIECYRGVAQKRWHLPLIALLLAAASFASLLVGYVWNPAAGCFRFPYHQPLAYVQFMSLMLAKFIGIKQGILLGTVVGSLVLLFALLVWKRHGLATWRAPHTGPVSLIITILLGYTLLFCLATAVGRICLGVGTAGSTRYMTFLIPGFLGFYFHLLALPRSRRRVKFLMVLFLALLAGSLQRFRKEMEWVAAGKSAWKACYLKREDAPACDQATGFQVYPWPGRADFKESMQYLKKNHLNLFADSK